MAVVVKVKYEDTLRRFKAYTREDGNIDLSLDGLKSKVYKLFQFNLNTQFVITYVDEDNDIVTMADNDDLCDAFHQGLNPLQLQVSLINQTDQGMERNTQRLPSTSRNHSMPNNNGMIMLTSAKSEEVVGASNGTEATNKISHNNDLGEQGIAKLKPGSNGRAGRSVLPGGSNHGSDSKKNAHVGENMHRVFHKDVECNVCGTCPIVGPRYKSTLKDDYDLCHSCFSESSNQAGYIKIDLHLRELLLYLQEPHLLEDLKFNLLLVEMQRMWMIKKTSPQA